MRKVAKVYENFMVTPKNRKYLQALHWVYLLQFIFHVHRQASVLRIHVNEDTRRFITVFTTRIDKKEWKKDWLRHANHSFKYLRWISRPAWNFRDDNSLPPDNKNWHYTPRKKFYLNLKNRFFNFISSIRSKNTFKTNINLFDFEKSSF